MDKIVRLLVEDWEQVRDPKDLIRFYSVGLLIVFTTLIHLFLFSYFLYFEITFFISYNLITLVLLTIMFFISRKGYCELSVTVVTLEVILSAILLTATYGWGSSFQWYILLALMPYYLFLEFPLPHKIAVSYVALFSMYFVFFISQITPLWLSNENININLLTFINLNGLIVICFGEIKMNGVIKEYVREMHEKYIESLENAAQKDPLTNLWNRRYAELYFDRETVSCRSFCIALIDIDHFKNINDTYGHEVGDNILIEFSRLLEHTFRSTDVIIRWGGEEFMVCLRQVSIESAYRLMENLRKINENKVYNVLGNDIQFTITIGIARYEKNKTVAATIQESDECMYYGKKNGRNLTVTKQTTKNK